MPHHKGLVHMSPVSGLNLIVYTKKWQPIRINHMANDGKSECKTHGIISMIRIVSPPQILEENACGHFGGLDIQSLYMGLLVG